MITLTTLIISDQNSSTPQEDVLFQVQKTETFADAVSYSRVTIVDVENYLTFLQPQIARMAAIDTTISNMIQEDFDRWNDVKAAMQSKLEELGFV